MDRCCRLLDDGEIDPALVTDLGGDGAAHVLSGHEGGPGGYWPRTWAVRAFLHVWDPSATPTVIAATGDEHWRVREMAAKVIAARDIHSAAAQHALERLATDDNARVRAAADRSR